MSHDEEIAAIKGVHCGDLCVAPNVWIIEERGADFIVHRWTNDGVAPTSSYPTLRKAASRLLQLLHTGPVAPQTWPEIAEIGTTAADGKDNA